MSNKFGLIFGDCVDGLKKLEDRSVHCILTDPPYGINYVSNHRKFESDVARPVENDASFDPAFFDTVFAECHRALAENTHAYFFCADDTLPEFVLALRKYFTIKNVLTWRKGNWTAGDLEGAYGKECEYIIFAHKGRRPLKRGRPSSYIYFPRVDPDKAVHSCQKPVPLMGFLIENSTDPGEVVCDPFAGSASTAIAALGLGRKFVGWEVDPKTYEIAQTRLGEMAAQASLF